MYTGLVILLGKKQRDYLSNLLTDCGQEFGGRRVMTTGTVQCSDIRVRSKNKLLRQAAQAHTHLGIHYCSFDLLFHIVNWGCRLLIRLKMVFINFHLQNFVSPPEASFSFNLKQSASFKTDLRNQGS